MKIVQPSDTAYGLIRCRGAADFRAAARILDARCPGVRPAATKENVTTGRGWIAVQSAAPDPLRAVLNRAAAAFNDALRELRAARKSVDG